jgi:tetratricopeptide (TPR) repeat protein
LGDVTRAADDAETMVAAARAARKPALLAQALAWRAFVEIRSGKARDAIPTAEAALQAARKSGLRALEAMALLRLGEAQFRQRANEQAVKTCTQAARMFKAFGMTMYEGRARWGVSAARSGQGRVDDADRAAREALELARRSGDLYGVGNALNMLTFHEADIAARKVLLQQALAAFEAAGYVERQGVVTHKLGNLYHELGLDRRARRLLSKAAEPTGARARWVRALPRPTGCWRIRSMRSAISPPPGATYKRRSRAGNPRALRCRPRMGRRPTDSLRCGRTIPRSQWAFTRKAFASSPTRTNSRSGSTR